MLNFFLEVVSGPWMWGPVFMMLGGEVSYQTSLLKSLSIQTDFCLFSERHSFILVIGSALL